MKREDLTIKLKKVITGHTVIREVVLREPVANDILPMGFPYSWQPTADGHLLFIENNAAIQYYAERLVVEPSDQIALFSQMGVEDTQVLRQKIMGFFLEAGRKNDTSGNSSTSSSSISDGDQPTSAA
ncbi:hypothetical protein ACQVP2_28315 [Methylobacterium aquaticum]|uniref:hypothetical protein n=1 Tax=Methylobacterium aquaticum TaxID=270351 RepID=UPI003D169B5B